MTDTLFETTGGMVRGTVVDGVRAFLGVPYGAPTAGAGRFRAPRPVQPWDGVRDALEYGPSSWQRAPAEAVAGGRAPDVPLLIGTTRDEHATFSPAAWVPADADDAWVADQVRPFVGDDAGRVVAAHRAQRPAATPRQLHVRIATDAVLRAGSIRFAEARLAAGGAPVWMYRFDWESPAEGFEGTAPHGVDTAFFFDNIDRAGVSAQGPHSLAAQASSSLVALAAGGSPEYAGSPAWPPYDLDRRATMLFDVESRAVDDPDAEARLIGETIP